MPQVLAVIGAIAGAVGAAGTIATALGVTAGIVGTITTIAKVVGALAVVGSMIFKPKPPPARGSVTKILVDPDAPAPYAMGEGPVGGVLRHDTAYGATLNKVPNPYRFLVTVLSVAGPVGSVDAWADMAAPSSYYSGFLYTDTQLGAVPESTALAPQWSSAPGWDSTSKLSGAAAIGWSLLFDKDGKVFSGGLPKLAGYGQWVKTYDPRLDSTFPGGSGAHRFDDETTWAWSENPALHALAYARGRFVDGVKVIGVGIPKEGLDLVGVADWANVCDANGWTIFGVIFEPGNRWENLKDICTAGGCEPVFAGGVVSWKYASPKVSLDTVTEEDLADAPFSVVPMASWRERINTIVPKFRSPDHDWELVDADPIAISTYVTADGEEKKVNWSFNFVKDVDQAAQLARYRLEDSREIVPIEITVKPRLRAYRPGECLHLDLPQLGLDHDCIILKREIDPATMTIKLTLQTESGDKHAYALGETGTPPPIPALGLTQEERDEIAVAAALTPSGYDASMIAQSYTTDFDPADGLLQGAATSLTVENHTRNYPDKAVSVTGGTLTTEDDGTTAIVAETIYHVYYDDAARSGGSVSLKATQSATAAANSATNSDRHYVGSITTDISGGGGTSAGGSSPGGWDPYYWLAY
jgi:hypothetical protein